MSYRKGNQAVKLGNIQKKQPRGVLQIKVFLKISQVSQKNICFKKRLQHRSFPLKFAKFLKISVLKDFYERLLLKICSMAELNLDSHWLNSFHL